ncbi:protease pro-enzyme activation domain-containing protein [Lentilactobacillus hilgardii]|uniref:Peptidase S53 activation domain-containing protein n=2 Tax=Lentilactobacillus hilgardii TaxID=1588 RepID=C0XK76_LENH9|nr:protease pro-enzyme activation domain-containing protein [Lentilactobacillus hilgardii]EEI24260.1 hypothetical protein HMPREF0519_1637 [Lentilactobacillus hilgardii DSM 20176 = ATCC 8290]KRK56744.1 hypothetical protein FD42_GL000289 [Lentilactobacillus hilgardii DSM 20176 = ATCC 8290]TDG86302.1 hypothetical protein C5L34_001786 [Lentilactobacillus hilgardii]
MKRRNQFIIAALSSLLFLSIGLTSKAKAVSNTHQVVVNIAFKPTSETNLTNYVYSTVDPNSINYHHYLTPKQFAQKFGEPNAYLSMFKEYLHKRHIRTAV